jgi:hypothetical protein
LAVVPALDARGTGIHWVLAQAVDSGLVPSARPNRSWLVAILQILGVFVVAAGVGLYLAMLTRTFLLGWHIGWGLW